MPKGYITIVTSGQKIAINDRLVIGRTKDCGIIIDDTAASRRHVEIRKRDGAFIWKDLGSTNGTIVNGIAMLAGTLDNSDQIQIGDTRFVFTVQDDTQIPTANMDSTHSLFKEIILDDKGKQQESKSDARSTALLETIYGIMNEIAMDYDLETLLDRILEQTMKAIQAQRGAIFLAESDQELPDTPVCQWEQLDNKASARRDKTNIRISKTVARRVLQGGENVLYHDNDNDSELKLSESILSLELRSILCVPIRAKQQILGILYVDSNRKEAQYNEDHLLLAAAVGNSAGLALENARMHRQMLEKQRMEQDIAIAWNIQEGFLVKDFPDNDPRFEVYGETRPAKTVGGDFYDVVQPNKETVGILIGDVSGKGVPAALTMAQLLAQFRLHARDLNDPNDVINALNSDLFTRSRRGIFCTLCYITLNLKTGTVLCSNAGHHPPLHINKDQVQSCAGASGPPAGVLPSSTWENTTFSIQPGDTLLLYTDGIAEARSMGTLHDEGGPNEYNTEGIQKVARAHTRHHPKVLLEAINNDVKRFCAPAQPHDDCTMIAVRYLGK